MEILSGLFLAKVAVSISVVIGLSLVAEHLGPRAAGFLTGMPLGAGRQIGRSRSKPILGCASAVTTDCDDYSHRCLFPVCTSIGNNNGGLFQSDTALLLAL